MNPRHSWRFTADEFAWVWSETGHEYPYPISIRESPCADLDEYDRRRADIATRHPHGDPDMTAALHTVLRPDVRITATGWMHHAHASERFRCLAVARDHGVVLLQSPGVTAEFGSNLILMVTNRDELGHYLAAALPSAPRGRIGQRVGSTARVRSEQPPSSYLREPDGKLPVEERMRALLRVPRSAEGYLRIEQGLDAGQPSAPHYLTWIDLPTEHQAGGRYLIDVNHLETTISPVSEQDIAAELARYL